MANEVKVFDNLKVKEEIEELKKEVNRLNAQVNFLMGFANGVNEK
ncbi:unnamed protein product [Fructobacillus tropaeoli]|nr:unnamed protein product [Fructobacillus tropaeoli]